VTVDMEAGEALYEAFRAAWFSQTTSNLMRFSSGKETAMVVGTAERLNR
jgi:hypothetical protein